MRSAAPITQYMAASTQFNPLSQQIIIYVRAKLYVLMSSVIRNVRSIIIQYRDQPPLVCVYMYTRGRREGFVRVSQLFCAHAVCVCQYPWILDSPELVYSKLSLVTVLSVLFALCRSIREVEMSRYWVSSDSSPSRACFMSS